MTSAVPTNRTEMNRPPVGAVHVWHHELTAQTARSGLLTGEESARADRVRVEAKRTQFIAARSVLRDILSRYLGEPAQEIRLQYGEHGKPVLADHRDLQFNLSHSRTVGLLAIGCQLPLGVDIEFHRPGRSFIDLAARFFSPMEQRALGSRREADQEAAFYRAWTLKEAYLKAHGTGLSFAANRFAIQFAEGGAPRLLATDMPGDDPDSWQLHSLPTAAGYAAALCHALRSRPVALADCGWWPTGGTTCQDSPTRKAPCPSGGVTRSTDRAP